MICFWIGWRRSFSLCCKRNIQSSITFVLGFLATEFNKLITFLWFNLKRIGLNEMIISKEITKHWFVWRFNLRDHWSDSLETYCCFSFIRSKWLTIWKMHTHSSVVVIWKMHTRSSVVVISKMHTRSSVIISNRRK